MSKKVAVMCGHGKQTNGKWDAGCAYAGYTEAGLMLPITKAAVKHLRYNGITVISDADANNNRNMISDVAWANKEKVALYVSIHCDYSKAPSGVYPLYVSSNGKKLATALNSAISKGMPMKSRGVARRTDLYELNYTDAPACILETGAIKADLKTFKNNYDKYGKLIAQGIMDYLGVKPKASSSGSATQTLYRVRKSWTDSKSQLGAYSSLENAKAECNKHPGYSVYGENGKVLYTNKPVTASAPKATPSVDVGKKVIDFAASQKGKYPTRSNAGKDGKKYSNKFTKYFAGRGGIDSKGQMPNVYGYIPGYCTLFVCYCLEKCGLKSVIPFSTLNKKANGYWWHAPSLMKWFKKKGLLKKDWSKAKRGAICFKGKNSPTHTCLLDKVDGSNVYTWDGNVGGGVTYNKRAKSAFIGYVNPPYK